MPTQPLLHWPTFTQAKSSKVNNNRMQPYVHWSFCLPTSGLGPTCHWRDVSFVFEACLHHCWPFMVKVRCARPSPPTRGDSWGPSGQSPLRVTKSSNEGVVPEALVVKVRYAIQSPPTRGSFLRPSVVKVCCTRQSPPTRGSFLRPFMVKVCCTWQSPQTRDSSWGPHGQSPLCKTKFSNRSRSLRPLRSKSTVHDKVLQQGTNYEAYPGQVCCV